MKKDAFLSKRAKAIMASAMAVTLAVPSVIMLNNTPAQAEAAVPDPIAVYNFEDVSKEAVELVDNEVAPQVKTDDDRKSTVLELQKSVKVDAVTQEVTKESVDASTGAVTIVTEMAVVTPEKITNSEAKVKNPFLGREDLLETPTFPSGDLHPVWEKGVTISYWQKTTEEDSSIINFSSTRENEIEKNDKDKYNLFKLYAQDESNPLFSLGDVVTITMTAGKGKYYNKELEKEITVKGAGMVGDYTVYAGCGPFVRFNKDYPGGGYYLKPAFSKTGAIKEYTLLEIKEAFRAEDYNDPASPTSQLRVATALGGLQFNASGAWAYNSCGNVDITKGGKFYLRESLDGGAGRNSIAIPAYVKKTDESTNKEVIEYVDASPLRQSGTWQYVTRVIKNDSVSTYINGVLKDKELYVNNATWEIGSVYGRNKGFNCGWGYYTSASEADEIISDKADTEILKNSDSIAVCYPNTGDWYTPDKTLGYNGNTNGMTIMQMLIHKDTTLSFGGSALGVQDIASFAGGVQGGVSIDSIAFFDQPLTNDQVDALYKKALAEDLTAPDPTPTPSPSEPVTGPGVSASPSPSQSSEPGSSEEPSPSTPSVDYTLGDVDNNQKIDLTDAQIILKAALKIIPLEGSAEKAADVDQNGKIDLTDAQLVLKKALKIIDIFPEPAS